MNLAPHSARLNPIAAAVASLLIAVPGMMMPVCAAENARSSTLPDLGGGAQGGTSVLAPSAGGVAFSGRLDDKRLSITPTYSDQTGLSVSAALASRVGESGAVGFLVTGGAEKKEALVNAGFMLDERQRVIFSAGQLRQFLEIGFDSGRDRAEMTQNSGAISYQLELGQNFLRFLEVNGYIAETASRDLADKTYAVDTAALFELFNDPRRVAGGRVTGVQGRLIFVPLANSNLKLSFGNERLQYDYLTGRDSTRRFTGGAEWNQQVGAGYSLKLAADSFAAQSRYRFGLERNLSGGQRLALNLATIQGRDGAPDDRQIGFTYTYALGGGGGSSGSSGMDFSGRAGGGVQGLVDQVAQRPSFLPAQPVAKRDTTAVSTRLVAVAKAGLPAGATIDNATGIITAPLGGPPLGIAGVTLNAAPFANAGQFSLSGNNIVINPSLITQPAVGVTDTYVVTLGSGTLVTVVVSHGSVRIDSITIGSGLPDVTPPTTTAGPSVSGTSDVATTLVATINEAGTGYYLVLPAATAAPSVGAVLAGTGFAMTANVAANVPIGGLTASTAYKIWFVAKDAVGNTQAGVASIGVTTAAAADVTPPTTTAAPSISGTTDTGTTLAATINEAGTGYYLVLAAAAPAPTVGAVIAGAHSFAMAANVAASVPITGLTAGTAYNIWFVAKDLVGNTQAGVASVAVTTTSGGANVAPVISAAVTAKIFNLGSAITPVVLPVATDANAGDTLTYSATNLPAGLSLDPVTHTLSGTPTASGSKTVTYTVTDNWGATDSKTFLINIIDQAPIVVPLAYPANGLGLSHTQVGGGSFSILDYGPLIVTLIADNGGTFNVTAASSGTVSGNGSSSVTITNAVSGAITYDYTSPAATGAGADNVAITVTDSDAVASSGSFTITY